MILLPLRGLVGWCRCARPARGLLRRHRRGADGARQRAAPRGPARRGIAAPARRPPAWRGCSPRSCSARSGSRSAWRRWSPSSARSWCCPGRERPRFARGRAAPARRLSRPALAAASGSGCVAARGVAAASVTLSALARPRGAARRRTAGPAGQAPPPGALVSAASTASRGPLRADRVVSPPVGRARCSAGPACERTYPARRGLCLTWARAHSALGQGPLPRLRT